MAVVRHLPATDVRALVAAIDRSEHVDVEYEVAGGRLVERPVTMAEIPPWDPEGDGPFSVTAMVSGYTAALQDGVLLGAFEGDAVAGDAVVVPRFERELAWLAMLHVSRAHRRHGAASGMWAESMRIAAHAAATSMYVSATPTASAARFYLSRGCELADPVHPELYEREPDDVHLICPVGAAKASR